MKRFTLPEVLEEEYNSIDAEFQAKLAKYHPNSNSPIPEDRKFMKKLINFIIKVLDHMIKNYEDVNILEYQDLLGYYHFDFLYGPNGDDMNYLDSGSYNLDGKLLQEFCFELQDEDFEASIEKLEEIKSRYVRLLEKI